jgi:hypothetical protein
MTSLAYAGNACSSQYTSSNCRQQSNTSWTSCPGSRSAFAPYCPGPTVSMASSPYPSPPLSHGRPSSSCCGLVHTANSAVGPRWSPVASTAADDDDFDENSWSSSFVDPCSRFDDLRFGLVAADPSSGCMEVPRNAGGLSAYAGRERHC